jgi:hypothetical protein
MSKEMERVNELLHSQYGMDLLDVDVQGIEQALADGEEPQAIVDDIGSKRGLTRNASAFAKDHIDSLVAYWRDLMVKQLGQVYADAVSNDDIRHWLLKSEEPKPEDEDQEALMLDELTRFIEDRL